MIAVASSPATPNAKTDQAPQSNTNVYSKSWHDVETWTLGVTALAAQLSFKDIWNQLHDVEDTLDGGSDDAQDKWREIKRRIEAIRNLRAIVSKRIHRLRRISIRFARRMKLTIERNSDGSITICKA
jgi:hypothetical protein